MNRGVQIALAAALALGACEPPPAAPRRPRQAADLQLTSAPTETSPELPERASAVVVHGDALLVARGSAVWRVPLPLGSAAAKRHPMPGPVAALLVQGDELLATVGEPGLLLRLKAGSLEDGALEDGALEEVSRLSIPGGAGAFVVQSNRAWVISPAGKVVTADLRANELVGSIDVAEPRRIALSAGGEAALVGQLIGMTRIELSDAPTATKLASSALDPVVTRAPTGEGLAAAFGELTLAHEPRAWAATVIGSEVKRAAVPAHVRAWRTPSAAAKIVAATDDEVLVLDAALAAVGEGHAHGCRDTRGMALSPDASHAYLLCADGRVADVPLAGGAPTYTALMPPPVVAVDCAKVKRGPIAQEFSDKFGTADQIHDWLRRYHCMRPELTDLIQLGETHLGRPLLALVVGKGPRLGHRRPTFLINGAHHGSELMSSTFALDALDQLLEHKHPAVDRWLREGVVFVVVPLVNPDGNMAYLKDGLLGRKNGRDTDGDGTRGHMDGVDLNRNYPFRWHSLGESASSSKIRSRYYRGPSPASEPETKAMMRLAESERFAGSISFHTGTLAILAPYTIPKVKNPSPNEAWTVAEEIAKRITGHPEGFVPVKKNLYAVDGTDQDWFRNEHGTLALLVEGADNWLVDAKTRQKMVFWIRRSWTTMVDRYLDGAAVGGFVYDAVMRPLEAEVSFAEIYRPEKESWTSRCRDGRFDRFVSRGGDYTLVVQHGESVVNKKLKVSKNKRVKTRVVLPLLVSRRARCPTIFDADAQPAKVIRVPAQAK